LGEAAGKKRQEAGREEEIRPNYAEKASLDKRHEAGKFTLIYSIHRHNLIE